VCRQTLAHPLADEIDGTLRAKGDEKNERESLAASLLLSIRDDIWTRLGMSLTDCRWAWARLSLRLRRFRPFRGVRGTSRRRMNRQAGACDLESLAGEIPSGPDGQKLRVSVSIFVLGSVFQECEHAVKQILPTFRPFVILSKRQSRVLMLEIRDNIQFRLSHRHSRTCGSFHPGVVLVCSSVHLVLKIPVR